MNRATRGPLEGQLDLFADSRDLMLRNDLLDAVLARDALAAQRAVVALAVAYPSDPALADAPCLVRELAAGPAPTFDRAAEAATALAAIEERLAPATQRLLGASASAAWLLPCWRDLARRAAPLHFSPTEATTHAAALWLRAGDWVDAAAAVETIESWRRMPQPLAWMVLARWHVLGTEATWPLLAELAWIAPQRMPDLLKALPDTRLHRLMQRFEADFAAEIDLQRQPASWAWLPAWALADDPRLAEPLEGAAASVDGPARQGLVLMQSLLRLERQGRHPEIVAARKRLRGLSQELFATYMRVR